VVVCHPCVARYIFNFHISSELYVEWIHHFSKVLLPISSIHLLPLPSTPPPLHHRLPSDSNTSIHHHTHHNLTPGSYLAIPVAKHRQQGGSCRMHSIIVPGSMFVNIGGNQYNHRRLKVGSWGVKLYYILYYHFSIHVKKQIISDSIHVTKIFSTLSQSFH